MGITLKEYQEFTPTTNMYPKAEMLQALALGLCSEAGEIAGLVKKELRGDDNPDFFNLLIKELGDCMYYLSEIANQHSIVLEGVLDINKQKLEGRKARGTIKGSGDER